MIKSTLQVLYYFIKSLFLYFFNWKALDKRLYLATQCLIENVSYSLKFDCSEDVFLAVRVLKRTIFDIFKTKHVVQKFHNNNITLYDNCFEEINVTIPYIEKMSGKRVGVFIDKSKILSVKGIVNKISLSITAIFVFCIVFLPTLLFKKRRINLSLLIAEISGCTALLFQIRKHKIKTLHYLSIPEIDSNFTAYVLIKSSVYVNKITSSNPITFSNKIMITNSLALSCKYQEEEVVFYNETMFYEKIENWIPFSAFSYIDKYLYKDFFIPKNSLGLYSSAGFIRHYLGDNNTEELLRNEDILLMALAEFLVNRKDIHLTIFLHPLEKKNIDIEIVSKDYYRKMFSGIDIAFSPKEIGTTDLFASVSLAISIYSTVSFERLFCGFKSIFFNADMDNFPTPDSALNNVCAKNRDTLFSLIENNIDLAESNFFKNNNIQDYCYYDESYNKVLPRRNSLKN